MGKEGQEEKYGLCEACFELKSYEDIKEEGEFLKKINSSKGIYRWTCSLGHVCHSFIGLDKREEM